MEWLRGNGDLWSEQDAKFPLKVCWTKRSYHTWLRCMLGFDLVQRVRRYVDSWWVKVVQHIPSQQKSLTFTDTKNFIFLSYIKHLVIFSARNLYKSFVTLMSKIFFLTWEKGGVDERGNFLKFANAQRQFLALKQFLAMFWATFKKFNYQG